MGECRVQLDPVLEIGFTLGACFLKDSGKLGLARTLRGSVSICSRTDLGDSHLGKKGWDLSHVAPEGGTGT